MKNTSAKDTSRNMFYDFAKKSFTKKELKNARTIVLLGKEMLEIPLLDGLGIKRSNITCIEEDFKVYNELYFWNLKQTSGQAINLYYGELNNYLKFLISRGQMVQIYNLDIFGSLQNNILPNFEKVIALSKQQPKTVIGIYFTAGRDAHVLVKAIQETAWLMMLDPNFKIVIENLVARFETVGYKTQIAFTHTFRIMQWIYETIRTLTKVEHPNRVKMIDHNRVPEQVWQQILFGQKSVTWEKFFAAVLSQKPVSSKIKDLEFDFVPTKISFLAYRNEQFTQLCHFLKIEKKKGTTLTTIIDSLINALMEFKFAKQDSTDLMIVKNTSPLNRDKSVILPPSSTDRLGREKFKKLWKDKPKLKKYTQYIKTASPTPSKQSLWNSRNGFTAKGKNFVYEFGRANPKATVKDIAEYFPKQTPRGSLCAFLSHSHREK